jgi:hypothetical protein
MKLSITRNINLLLICKNSFFFNISPKIFFFVTFFIIFAIQIIIQEIL